MMMRLLVITFLCLSLLAEHGNAHFLRSPFASHLVEESSTTNKVEISPRKLSGECEKPEEISYTVSIAIEMETQVSCSQEELVAIGSELESLFDSEVSTVPSVGAVDLDTTVCDEGPEAGTPSGGQRLLGFGFTYRTAGTCRFCNPDANDGRRQLNEDETLLNELSTSISAGLIEDFNANPYPAPCLDAQGQFVVIIVDLAPAVAETVENAQTSCIPE